MAYILVIWTFVGAYSNGNTSFQREVHDWRPIGSFASQTACQTAAANLGFKPGEKYRCLATGEVK